MTSLQSARKYTTIGLIVYVFIYYGLLLLFPNQVVIISDSLSPFAAFCSICIISWSLKWQSKLCKKVWIVFLIGNSFFLLGDLSWFYFEIWLKQEVSSPSICDIFYIINISVYFVAIILYINVKSIYNFLRSVFDILITLVVTATLSWKYVMMPIYQDVSLSSIAKLVSLAYPISDLGFLCGALTLYFIERNNNDNSKATKIIIAAISICFISDQIYSIESAFGVYASGGLIDPLLPTGIWLLAIASLWTPRLNTISNVAIDPPANSNSILKQRMRIILPYSSFGILIIIISFRYIAQDPLITGATITSFLIIIRQVFTLLENQRLIALIKQNNQSLSESKLDLQMKNAELQKLNFFKEQEAHTDFLTGLFNRRYIDQKLKTLLKEMQMNHQILSLLLIDIDKFKEINDQWGHDMGDLVLQQMATRIKKNIRSVDIAGRFGGDEFIIILPGADLNLTKTIGEGLCQQFACENFMLGGKPQTFTLSIGATQWQEGKANDDVQSIITRVDEALYEAKNAGRNRVVAI